ncbi:MAG: hypothetical protein V1875_02695 [Candidatus Altiarchaeota archaeon]
MRVYDVVHGYQPFTRELVSDWVAPNLQKIFLPTSKAMAEGLVRRSVQLQGWTIDAWLSAPKEISSPAATVLSNLRCAKKKNNIEFGFSSYGHALLPLLGERLTYASMLADYETVKTRLAEPTFFWFPENAVDATRLRILHERFTGKIAVIPSGSVGGMKTAFLKLTGLGAPRKAKPGSRVPSHYGCESPLKEGVGPDSMPAALANTLVKDVLMNSTVYEKPGYVPPALDWGKAKKSMRDGKELSHTLSVLDPGQEHLIVRDWENGESRDSLRHIGDKADVSAMMDPDVEYRLLSEAEYAGPFSIKDVRPSCWEPYSTPANPYPYWAPTNMDGWKTKAKDYWLEILSIYERGFDAAVGEGGLDSVDDAFRNKGFNALFKRTSPALLSCLPWHLFARPEWERFPEFPRQLLEKIVLPYTTEMLAYAGQEREVDWLIKTVKNFINTISLK